MVCTEPGVRFFAGAPLVASNGARIGALCVPLSQLSQNSECLLNFADVHGETRTYQEGLRFSPCDCQYCEVLLHAQQRD